MSDTLKPAHHGREHRPVGWEGVDDPGGEDPLDFLTPTAVTYNWARRRQYNTTNQSVTSGSERDVALNEFWTDNGTLFTAFDSGTHDGVTVHSDGLYAIHFRLYWVDYPGNHEAIINGIDPDNQAGYVVHHSAVNNTYSSLTSLVARLNSSRSIYPSVYHEFGSARNLDGFAGNHLEIVFLGAIDLGHRSDSVA